MERIQQCRHCANARADFLEPTNGRVVPGGTEATQTFRDAAYGVKALREDGTLASSESLQSNSGLIVGDIWHKIDPEKPLVIKPDVPRKEDHLEQYQLSTAPVQCATSKGPKGGKATKIVCNGTKGQYCEAQTTQREKGAKNEKDKDVKYELRTDCISSAGKDVKWDWIEIKDDGSIVVKSGEYKKSPN